MAKAVRCLMLTAWLGFFIFTQLATILLLARPLADGQWHLHATANSPTLIDFSQSYQAGQLAVSKQALHIYEPEVQKTWANGLIRPYVFDKTFYNQSVPFLYVICIPFGFLPYSKAYVVWCLFWEVLCLSILGVFLQRHSRLQGTSRLLFLTGVMASIPAYLCVWHGQTTFLLLACFTLFTHFLLAGKNLWAGVSFALTTFKPQYALLFASGLLGARAFKVLLFSALFEVCLMLVAALFLGFENIVGYPHVLLHAEGTEKFIGVNPNYMTSVRGLLSVLLQHKTAMLTTIGLLFACLLPWGWLAHRLGLGPGKFDSEKGRWYLALTFVAALILSPHTHYFDCLLLAVPAALTLPSLNLVSIWAKADESGDPNRFVWYRLWCTIMVLYPLVSWPINFVSSRELEGICFLVLNSALMLCGGLTLQKLAAAKTQQG